MSRAVAILAMGAVLACGCANGAPAPGTNVPARDAGASDQTVALAAQAPPARAPAAGPLDPSNPNVAIVGGRPMKMDQIIPADALIATVNGKPITMRQFIQPLIEAHGLVVLMNMVRLEVLTQSAATGKIIVTPDDFAAERRITLDAIFRDQPGDQKMQEQLQAALAKKTAADAKGDKEASQAAAVEAGKIRGAINFDRQQFVEKLLGEQHLSPTDFDTILKINAYLRKIAARGIEGRLTEDYVRTAFGQRYGEKARVKYIELGNLDQVNTARRRLAAGEHFEDVARDMSLNRQSAALGGDMLPFSRATTEVPQSFKDVTFALKPGVVSDPVMVGADYLLVKLLEIIPPTAVKYDDVKASLRADLDEKFLQAAIRQLRETLDTDALRLVKIENQTMASQFEQAQNRAIRDRDTMNAAMERDRLLNQPPTTTPATGPTTAPTTTAPALVAPAPQPGPPAAGPIPAPSAPAAAGAAAPATQPGQATRPVPG